MLPHALFYSILTITQWIGSCISAFDRQGNRPREARRTRNHAQLLVTQSFPSSGTACLPDCKVPEAGSISCPPEGSASSLSVVYQCLGEAVPAGQRPQLNKSLRITVIPDEDHLQGTTSPNHPSGTALATPSVESGPDQLGSLCPFSLSLFSPLPSSSSPSLSPSLSGLVWGPMGGGCKERTGQ